MKKVIFALLIVFMTGVSIGFAAPINNLDKGQTAIGIVRDDFYVEHKLTNNLTIGLQEDDIYGQFNFNRNFRAIIGSRDYNGSELYVGAAVNTVLAPKFEGYASLIFASEFNELQVGANYNIARNVDLNINYRNFRPDEGSNSHRTGLGATFKF